MLFDLIDTKEMGILEEKLQTNHHQQIALYKEVVTLQMVGIKDKVNNIVDNIFN